MQQLKLLGDAGDGSKNVVSSHHRSADAIQLPGKWSTQDSWTWY